MILMICDADDLCGLWLTAEIARRGYAVQQLLPDELMNGSRLQLHVTQHGDDTTLRSYDGNSFHSAQLHGVINRMAAFPQPCWADASDEDLIYASEEMRAATVAWFAALPCPVFNRPTPYGSAGPSRSDYYWRTVARRSGLPIAPLCLSPEDLIPSETEASFTVIGNSAIDADGSPLVGSDRAALLSFAQALNLPLFRADGMVDEAGNWHFVRIELMPELRVLGSVAVDLLLKEMMDR